MSSMAHTITHGRYLQIISGGCCNPQEVEHVIETLVAFAPSGLRAPTRRSRE